MTQMPNGSGTVTAVIAATIAGTTANVILGASSLFWRALGAISSEALLCYRIVVSLVTLLIAMTIFGKGRQLVSAISKKNIFHHLAAALLVSINWGTFIWASIHGHVLESGIGYLIAPFVAIGVGASIHRDPMSGLRRFAVFVIIAGVLLLLFRSGELNPAVFLIIGATWGGYAYFKKTASLDAFSGLFLETALLSLFLCIAVPTSSLSFQLPEGLPLPAKSLLALCGLVSLIPLWLFSYAAKNLALSTMGFFQFILPTTQLIIALVFYHQRISSNTLICFSIIWAALLLIVMESFVGNLRLGAFIPSNRERSK